MSEFHLFSLLTAEIRHQVWRLLLPQKRIIEPPRYCQDQYALRKTCRESRKLFLEVYHQVLVPQYQTDHLRNLLKPGKNVVNSRVLRYMDPKEDLLIFDHAGEFSLLEHFVYHTIYDVGSKALFDSVRSIATNFTGWRTNVLQAPNLEFHENLLLLLAKYFPRLEEFIILLGQPLPAKCGPFQLPIESNATVAGLRLWETRGCILDKARQAVEETEVEYPGLTLPNVKVFFRTFDGLWDVENDCYPWGNNGC